MGSQTGDHRVAESLSQRNNSNDAGGEATSAFPTFSHGSECQRATSPVTTYQALRPMSLRELRTAPYYARAAFGPLHCFVSPASRKFRINATVSVGRSSISQCPEPT